MSTFDSSLLHLFNLLRKDALKDPFTTDKRDILLKNISALDEKGQEMLYVIVKYYWHETTKSKDLDALPYESKFVSKNLRFDFEKFPLELKWMVNKFVKMHLSRMEEDKNRINLEKNL